MQDFVNPPFKLENQDRYVIRSAIYRALRSILPNLYGSLLDVGCGQMPYKSYIMSNLKVTHYVGLDIEGAIVYNSSVKPDCSWDGVAMSFDSETFDCAIATEVLEHCPEPEITLKEIQRVLRKGGLFFFTVPFLWNLHEVPHDEFRYTPFSLSRQLERSGFRNIQIYATGGWHLAMAQMLGLWVCRSPMSQKKRYWLKRLIMPVMRILIRFGEREKVQFKEGQMITGLYGTAEKA
jgi:SAM-dependent methyltransferase